MTRLDHPGPLGPSVRRDFEARGMPSSSTSAGPRWSTTRRCVRRPARGDLRGYAVDEICFDPTDPAGRVSCVRRVLQSAHSAWWRDEVLAGGQMFARAVSAAADGAPIDVVPAARALVGQAR